MKYENILSITLSALGIKHTKSFTSKLQGEHPDKNNLFGLASMLQVYGVVTHGFQLENPDTLKDLDTPFIAHRNGKFNLVYACNETTVTFQEEGTRRSNILPFRSFVKSFSGVILTMDTDSQTIEPDYQRHHRSDILMIIRKIVWFSSIVVLLSAGCFQKDIIENTGNIFYLVLNGIGLFLCWLLLQKQVKKGNKLADAICHTISNDGCDDVLSSDAATIMGDISWSELGFAYFMTNIDFILCSPSIITLIALGNMLILPLTVVSIVYQKIKIKHWCGLCLLVITVLWLMAAVAFGAGILTYRFNVKDIILLCCGYLILSLAVHYYLTNRVDSVEASLQSEYNRLLDDPAIFEALLKQQDHYKVAEKDSIILFGDPDASIRVTVFSNPHCGPCARLHRIIKDIIGCPNIEVQYILTSFGHELEDSNKFLIASYLEKGRESFSLFNDWYEYGKKQKERFMSQHPVNMNAPIVEAEMKRQFQCFSENRVQATPLILINGFTLPREYSIDKLKHILFLLSKTA